MGVGKVTRHRGLARVGAAFQCSQRIRLPRQTPAHAEPVHGGPHINTQDDIRDVTAIAVEGELHQPPVGGDDQRRQDHPQQDQHAQKQRMPRTVKRHVVVLPRKTRQRCACPCAPPSKPAMLAHFPTIFFSGAPAAQKHGSSCIAPRYLVN